MMSAVNPASWLTGYIPDLPTPFDEAGAVDLKAFERLCERQIAAGVPAFVVCDIAGEASTLSPTERESIMRTAVDVAHGRVRLIAGAGSNSTSHAIKLTRRAEALGADAVLSVVPYYNKPTAHVMIFRPVLCRRSVPGRKQKRHQQADRVAQEGDYGQHCSHATFPLIRRGWCHGENLRSTPRPTGQGECREARVRTASDAASHWRSLRSAFSNSP